MRSPQFSRDQRVKSETCERPTETLSLQAIAERTASLADLIFQFSVRERWNYFSSFFAIPGISSSEKVEVLFLSIKRL